MKELLKLKSYIQYLCIRPIILEIGNNLEYIESESVSGLMSEFGYYLLLISRYKQYEIKLFIANNRFYMMNRIINKDDYSTWLHCWEFEERFLKEKMLNLRKKQKI